MKTPTPFLLALLGFAPAALSAHNHAAAWVSNPAAATVATATAKRYPLKGVVVEIYPDQSSVLVKHEAIPDYMMAMTMMFKVDAATLKSAVKGETITATIVERDNGLWLEDLKPVEN